MNTFGTINDATGFANGARFTNEREVREYFTVATQRVIFDADADLDQVTLDAMADAVIANRWWWDDTP